MDVGSDSEGSDEDSVPENTYLGFTIGDTVRKFFPFYGWFDGGISAIKRGNVKCFHVSYTDGDFEDLSRGEMDIIAKESDITIGAEGFKFLRSLGEITSMV